MTRKMARRVVLCQRPLPPVRDSDVVLAVPDAGKSPPSGLSALVSRAKEKEKEKEKMAIPAYVKYTWWTATATAVAGAPITGTAGRLLAALEVDDCRMARSVVEHTFELVRDKAQRDTVELALLTMLEESGTTHVFLRHLLVKELAETSSPQMILRRNTPVARVLSHYFRLVGQSFLRASLSRTLEYIYNSPPIEISRDRGNLSDAQVRQNISELLLACQGLLDMVTQNWFMCPLSLRRVVYSICEIVEQRFPGYGKGAVGAFVFLRFLCPAVLSPHKQGLIDSTPTPAQQRTLLLVTKLVQSLVNSANVELGLKEECMHLCQAFIKENAEPLQEWFGLLCQPPKEIFQEGDMPRLHGSLWTCEFCNVVNQAELPACPRCSTPAPERSLDAELSSTLEHAACKVSAHIHKHAQELREGCKLDEPTADHCVFSPLDQVMGAASDFMEIEDEGQETLASHSSTQRFETALLANGSAVLFHMVDSVSVHVESTIQSAVMLSISRGCGLAFVQHFLLGWQQHAESTKVFSSLSSDKLSLCTRKLKHALMSYMTLTLSRKLRSGLREMVAEVMNEPFGAGPEPNVSGPDAVEANLDRLDDAVQAVVDSFADSKTSPATRSLLQLICSTVEDRFPTMGPSAVSAFLACFVADAIMHPYEHGLCNHEPEEEAQDSLCLVGGALVNCFAGKSYEGEMLDRLNESLVQRSTALQQWTEHVLRKTTQPCRVAQYEAQCMHQMAGWATVRQRSLKTLRQLLSANFASLAVSLRERRPGMLEEAAVSYQPVDRLLAVVSTVPVLSPVNSPFVSNAASLSTSPTSPTAPGLDGTAGLGIRGSGSGAVGVAGCGPGGSGAGSLTSGLSEKTASVTSRTTFTEPAAARETESPP